MLIDFHSHILPEADHGSDNLEMSLTQVEMAKEAGISAIVATPHFYANFDSAADFLRKRKSTYQLLREALPQGAPQILLGGEVQLCRGLERMEELELLCVEGTNVLLLELPRNFSIKHYEQTLDALLYEKKLTVVLAHIDRYSSSVVDLLLDLGFYGQLNYDAFTRWRTRRLAQEWAESGRVVALGSDIHGIHTGYKDLPNVKKRLGSNFDTIMSRTRNLIGL